MIRLQIQLRISYDSLTNTVANKLRFAYKIQLRINYDSLTNTVANKLRFAYKIQLRINFRYLKKSLQERFELSTFRLTAECSTN